MLMDADVGEGSVKNQPKSANVVYGQPLRIFSLNCAFLRKEIISTQRETYWDSQEVE